MKARNVDKEKSQALDLAAVILSGSSVGVVGSDAQVIVVGPRAAEIVASAFEYAQEFLDGLD